MMHAQLLQRPATGRLQFVELAKGRLDARMLMPRSAGSGVAGTSSGPVAPAPLWFLPRRCTRVSGWRGPRDVDASRAMWRVALRVWDAQLLEIVDGLTYVPLLDVFGGLDLETMLSPHEFESAISTSVLHQGLREGTHQALNLAALCDPGAPQVSLWRGARMMSCHTRLSLRQGARPGSPKPTVIPSLQCALPAPHNRSPWLPSPLGRTWVWPVLRHARRYLPGKVCKGWMRYAPLFQNAVETMWDHSRTKAAAANVR